MIAATEDRVLYFGSPLCQSDLRFLSDHPFVWAWDLFFGDGNHAGRCKVSNAASNERIGSRRSLAGDRATIEVSPYDLEKDG